MITETCQHHWLPDYSKPQKGLAVPFKCIKCGTERTFYNGAESSRDKKIMFVRRDREMEKARREYYYDSYVENRAFQRME